MVKYSLLVGRDILLGIWNERDERVDQIAILEDLYGRIMIPHAVLEEMLCSKAPAAMRARCQNPP